MKLSRPLALAALSLALFAQASENGAPLQVQRQGALSYVSGGIGGDEQEALRSVARQYNLRMTFAATNGEYLSDVRVRVADDKGTVLLDTVAQGPFLFVALAPGHYKIVADTANKAIEKSANVTDKKAAEVFFYWTIPDLPPRQKNQE